MTDKAKQITSYDILFGLLSVLYVGNLLFYALFMWESRQRYAIIFLCMTLMLCVLVVAKHKSFWGLKGRLKNIILSAFFVLSLAGGLYFWVEYQSLVYERAGDVNNLDILVSAVYIYMVIQFTWSTSGPIIPTVTLVFAAYGLFGHWLPGFLHHPYISWNRFTELSCAEINGIFGPLNQIGATWIAIFGFFAGFIQGFGGLEYILRTTYRLVGRNKVGVPQVAVLASMGFGGMSGSAGANAAGTGSFTIPTMKRFGMPASVAASIESVASSGGQIMPPILGAAAFVMCDYLNMYYYQILLASIWPSILFFGSTMLSVHFLAKRYIDPNAEVDMPPEFKKKMTPSYLLQGVPIAFSFIVLLFVFIAFQVNILIGGFFSIASFFLARFVYELIAARGKTIFLWTFVKGVFRGAISGTRIIFSIGIMLAALGIVIRVLTTTGLAEKLSYHMVSAFGSHLWLLLFFTMVVCIVFGMAVTTVAAYILVVTLAAPALVKVGIEPIVAHFAVFYWAMLSGITPPVAPVCVITAGIGHANFLHTCWESMKLGFPKFIMPFMFIAYSKMLSFSLGGFYVFILGAVAFCALSAGIQSGWGWWQQGLLIIISAVALYPTPAYVTWTAVGILAVIFPVMWWKCSSKIAYQARKPFGSGLRRDSAI